MSVKAPEFVSAAVPVKAPEFVSAAVPVKAPEFVSAAVPVKAPEFVSAAVPVKAPEAPADTPPVVEPFVAPVKDPSDEGLPGLNRPWKVIVWDDPVNLMSYVTFVFRKLFGYSQAKAHKLMMQVHTEGKAVVSSGPKEKAEHEVFCLHEHGLWATMEQDR